MKVSRITKYCIYHKLLAIRLMKYPTIRLDLYCDNGGDTCDQQKIPTSGFSEEVSILMWSSNSLIQSLNYEFTYVRVIIRSH